MGSVLTIKGIKKTFPGIKALDWEDNDELVMQGGNVYALLGENGAGKSTLSKIIAGIYKQDFGTIMLDDIDFHPNNSKEARDMGIGIVLQESGMISSIKVSENLLIGQENSFSTAGIYSLHKQHMLAKKMMSDICPEISPTTTVRDLSLEDQKMVELARAIYVWPKVLLIDETSAALSKKNVDLLFNKIEEAKRHGCIVIMVTHRMEEVFQLGDKAVIMKDGKLVTTLDVCDTCLDEISKLMVGRAVAYERMREKKADPNRDALHPILEVHNLGYEDAFKSLDFTLKKGDILGIAGLSGGGKEEILPSLFGELKPTSGTIKMNGADIEIKTPRQAIDQGVAYVPRNRDRDGLILRQSISMNIVLPMFSKLSKKGFLNPKNESNTAERYSKDLLVKCQSVSDACDSLSGGNRQKVILARWVANDTRILLLDNPTRGIDVGARAEIYRLLNRLSAEGVGIIMVSDDLPEILSMSDEIMVIRRGEVSCYFDESQHPTEHDVLVHMI